MIVVDPLTGGFAMFAGICFLLCVDVPGPLGLGRHMTLMESLILAQDERWRRA